LYRKVAVALAALIVLSAGAVVLLVTPGAVREAREQVDASLRVRALMLRDIARHALASGADAASVARLHEEVQALGEATGTRLTIVDATEKGKVLADSLGRSTTMDDPHGLRPEIVQARESGELGTSTRFSHTTDIDMRYLAVPVTDGDRLLGFARASLPLVEVQRRRAAIWRRVGLGAAVAAALGLVIGLLLTRRLTARLSAMADAAKAIAEGREAGPLPVRATDETGTLARAIQQLDEELRRRLDALAHERNELTAVLGSMLEGVVAVDRSERVVHMNAVAAKLLKTSAPECIGQRIWEVTRIQEVCQMLETVLRDNAEHGREIRIADAPRGRILELHASPLRDAARAPAGAVVVLHDVTELRRLEAVRREFIANVSHELKTPLTAIRGLVETLLDDGRMSDETRRRFLEKARNQALRLSALVSDLLVLSRIESEEGAVERRPLDLRSPVRESARRLDPAGEGRDLLFRVSVPDDPVRVLGDEEAVRQIIDNLLSNAFKYTADGGVICLRLFVTNRHAIVEVEDTGIGIEPEHLDRIFERFYRVDKARSRDLGGTGLGLSIVKHLVDALDGQVDVESLAGKGTTFRVSVPLSEPPSGLDDGA
jgi:two-component system phosphate regulon sensor histidine kinase PhoR